MCADNYWIIISQIETALREVVTLPHAPFPTNQGENSFIVGGLTVKFRIAPTNNQGTRHPSVDEILANVEDGHFRVFRAWGTLASSEYVGGAWWRAIAEVPAFLAGVRAEQVARMNREEAAEREQKEQGRIAAEMKWLSQHATCEKCGRLNRD